MPSPKSSNIQQRDIPRLRSVERRLYGQSPTKPDRSDIRAGRRKAAVAVADQAIGRPAEVAPRLTRAAAAHLLHTDPERLVASLEGRTTGTDAAPTGTGLREDQAAAAPSVLTDGRRVSVINARRRRVL
jgi:hypothetical protein